MKIFELKNKQVINEEDCCIIGCVIDIDFDPKNGCINSIIKLIIRWRKIYVLFL